MRSKVSSDWLPSYIKVTRPVLEIINMAGYFRTDLVILPLVSLKKTVSQKYFVTSAADLGSFETVVPEMKSR